MAIRLHTNLPSMAAQRRLAEVNVSLGSTTRKLSSGLRIDRAADDAAGLGISERMRARERSLRASARGVQDAASLTRTASAALGTVHESLARLRELTLSAMTGTTGALDEATLDTEYQEVVDEIGRIIEQTDFAGRSLFTENVTLDIHAGTDGDDLIELELRDMRSISTQLGLFALDTTAGQQNVLGLVDTFTDFVSTQRGTLGAKENRFTSVLASLSVQAETTSASESRLRDLDYAEASAQLTRDSILQQAGVSVLAQANVSPELALSLLS